MKNIANTIAAARKRRGYTQSETARRAGISRQHMSHIENSKDENPRLATLAKIAKALNCRLVVEFVERGT